MAIITDPDSISDATEYTINQLLRTFSLNSGSGNLDNDGVTLQAIYSSFKDDWKDDPQGKSLIAYPFPMVAITPEQFEMIYDWAPDTNTTRKLIRTGGWREIDTENNTRLKAEYSGIITLGNFESATSDIAYYQAGDDPTDTASTTDFSFAGPVNEAILVYNEVTSADGVTGFGFTSSTIIRQDGLSWVTEGYRVGAQVTVLGASGGVNSGTQVITGVTNQTITVSGTPFTADTNDTTARFATNYRNAIKVFLRIRDTDTNGKTFSQSTLTDIGVTEVGNQVYRFPLSNATDLKITETDANIASLTPYTEIVIKYFDGAFTQEVDTPGVLRNFGVVIDVGTHSGIDATFGASGYVLTTADGGLPTSPDVYDGGTLFVLEDTPGGAHIGAQYSILSTTSTTITITGGIPKEGFATGGTNISFYAQRSSPVTATAEEIYEKVQYLLRQATDIDDSGTGVVTGKTADELLEFVGDSLRAGSATPSNPNGGGSGVAIIGFDSNDTNRISLFDNLGTERSFPFVAAGTINFNDNLVNDSGPAEYTMFFQYTSRTTVTDMALSSAGGTATASLDSAGAGLPTLTQFDYINLQGFSNAVNNGIWRVEDATPTATQADVIKVNKDVVVNETGASRTLDINPINSPDAIIVQNNSGANITGTIGGSSVSFDFDYDGNIQGGRTSSTDAVIIIRAIGTDTAQFVETTGTITQNTGLTFSLVASLERNYLA